MDILQHSSGDANDQHFQISPGAMFDATRDIDHQSRLQVDFLIVQKHSAVAVDDVVNLIGALVVVKFGVGDFQMMHFRRGAVRFLDQRANLAARLGPGSH